MQSMIHVCSFGPKIWWFSIFPVPTWRISWRIFWIKVQVEIFQIETNVESSKGEDNLFERTILLILSSKLLVDSLRSQMRIMLPGAISKPCFTCPNSFLLAHLWNGLSHLPSVLDNLNHLSPFNYCHGHFKHGFVWFIALGFWAAK